MKLSQKFQLTGTYTKQNKLYFSKVTEDLSELQYLSLRNTEHRKYSSDWLLFKRMVFSFARKQST